MTQLSSTAFAVALVALCATLTAQDKAPPIDPALRARFGFLGPEVKKIGWGIDLLTPVDLDGKGKSAIVLQNGRRGRLEILRLAQKDGEATLEAEQLGTPGGVHALAAADLDGDGVRDLLLWTARGRLRPILRGKSAKRVDEIDVGRAALSGALRTGDLDGDGTIDAVCLTREGLRTVTKLTTAPQVSPAVPVRAQRLRSFELTDIDGDGKLDILVATSDSAGPLRVKLGRGGARFGPWIVFHVERLHRVFPGTGAGGRPTLATIEGAQSRVVEYALLRAKAARRPPVTMTTLPEQAGV